MNWKNDTSLTIRSSRKGCSEAIMADYKKSSVHCHSTMCDGKNTLQDMASAACAQGLTTLGFTGHSYTQRDREYCMSPSRTAQYKATIAKLKAEYKGKVDILCGIEWDILSEDKRTGYDYWIGSAHHLYGSFVQQIGLKRVIVEMAAFVVLCFGLCIVRTARQIRKEEQR